MHLDRTPPAAAEWDAHAEVALAAMIEGYIAENPPVAGSAVVDSMAQWARQLRIDGECRLAALTTTTPPRGVAHRTPDEIAWRYVADALDQALAVPDLTEHTRSAQLKSRAVARRLARLPVLAAAGEDNRPSNVVPLTRKAR